ncbi:MAG: EamA family transporter, partial [Tardiphaga sp.]
MKNVMLSWPFWALLSAGFAALTAIFAKVGIENVNSDFATFIRTIVILLAAGMMVYVTGNWQSPSNVSAKTWVFLV